MKVHPRIAAARERSRARLGAAGAEAGGARAGRLPETALLVLSSLVVAAGLLLTYSAKSAGEGTPESPSFEELARRVERKEVVNLNAGARASDLAPVLVIDRNATEADRQFAADELEAFLKARGPLPNVGALSQARVEESKLEDPRRGLDFYRARLDAERRRAEARAQGPAESSGGDDGARPARALSVRLVPSVGTDKPSLVVRTPAEFRRTLLLYFALYLAGFYLVHLVWRAKRFRGDQVILPALHLLSGLGLIMTVSLFDPLRDRLYFPVFAQGALAGCVLLLAVSFTDFQASSFRRLALVPLALAFALSLLLILWGTAPEGSGARVNLSLGPVSFQPVEIITRLIVLFLAAYFARNWEFLRELKEERAGAGRLPGRLNVPRLAYFVPLVLGMGLAFLFFRAQQDLGPALVMFFTFVALYAVARRRTGMVLASVAVLVCAFAASYYLNSPRTIRPRVQMWLSPWDAPGTYRDQIARSLWALSTGATTGTGLGLGDAGEGALPAFHTDLVLAALGEELGFAGVVAVFALLGVLLHRSFRVALRAPGDYSFFLALGLATSVAVQCVLITGGTLGVLPLSGVVLPFLSFGRSALIANFAAFGVLAAISARARAEASEAERSFGRPTRVVVGVLAAAAVVVLSKAAYVQVLRADDFVARAHVYTVGTNDDGTPARRRLKNSRLVAAAELIQRGTVYDRKGVPLETSRREELDAWRGAYAQAGVFVEQLAPNDRGRFRPFGGPAAHLFIDLEEDHGDYMRGYSDDRELIPLLRYRFRPDAAEYQRVVTRGRDLHLSIDIHLQLDVARLLEAKLGPEKKAGAAVVTDAQTGEILASVSYPWPGAEMADRLARERRRGDAEAGYRAELLKTAADRTRLAGYLPGSTFKIVTAIAALRKDPALDARTYECRRLDETFVGNRVRGRVVRDFRGDPAHGERTTLSEAIYKSCNAYFAQLGTDAVGARDLHDTARLLRIERLAEAEGGRGVVERLEETLAEASFGQGELGVSPRSMARVAAVVANGGEVPPDVFVRGGPDVRAEPRVAVLAPAPAARLARYMHEVVANPQGTAHRHVSAQYRDVIAGKTGTAQTGHRVGARDVTHAWFMGFAPYAAPDRRRVAFSVVLEYREDGVGGRDAAPLAEKIVAAARARGHIQ